MTVRTDARSPLQLPRFARFLCGRATSAAGNQMMLVAIGWQMYSLTGSAWDLGLVGLCQFLPSVVLTLPAGHAADRGHRGHILALSMAAQTTVALLLTVAAHTQWADRNLLLLLSIALGAAKAFQNPAQQALVPLLVPVSMLSRAMALSASSMQVAIIGGPALGGILYVAGDSVVYAVCAALFALAGGFFLAVRHVHMPPPAEPVSMHTVFAGFRFIWQREQVLGAISLDLFAVLLGGAVALLPIYAKDILHVGPWGLGLLRAAPAVGALLMSVALSRRPIERRAGRRMFQAVAVFGLCMIVFGFSTSLVISFAALMVSGMADMVSVVVRQSLVQLDTPNEMRGRVSAVNSIFIGASNQLGEFESGATAALLGPVGSVVAGGIGTLLVAALWMRWFPALAKRDRLQEK
ncbi:MAG TPA: MFS transporter [Usitatibacteraceae bacterium]